MINVIDKVVCIRAIKGPSVYHAIIGKQYDVIRYWGNNYIDIINEIGVLSTCMLHNFVSIDKYREIQLKKLGV
jgi:hypothetical protein